MAQAQSDTRRFILQAMVSMAAADGEVQDSEMATVRNLYSQFTGDIVSADEVSAATRACRARSFTFADLLARARGRLTPETRETILKGAYLVVIADGRVGAREHKRLSDFVEALKISELHRSVIFEDAERIYH
jgi:tellurite resistance protein